MINYHKKKKKKKKKSALQLAADTFFVGWVRIILRAVQVKFTGDIPRKLVEALRWKTFELGSSCVRPCCSV